METKGDPGNTQSVSEQSEAAKKVAYWENRWATGQSQWHKKDINPFLLKYFDELKGDGEKNMRFLFPLCGKSLDVIWVYEKGYSVIGIEAVQSVVEELFTESNISYTKSYKPEIDGWIYESSGDEGRLKVFCCDLFKMNLEILETPIDRVFDRGSYVAIEREDREKYVKLMLTLMSPKFKYLLAAVQYDPTRFDGPPRHADREELTNFYTTPDNATIPNITVKLLEETDREPEPRFNLDWMNNAIYLIKA